MIRVALKEEDRQDGPTEESRMTRFKARLKVQFQIHIIIVKLLAKLLKVQGKSVNFQVKTINFPVKFVKFSLK